MNERIKELADQVMKDAKGGLNFEQFYEKFAELIVRECANVARQHNLEKADRSHMVHKVIKEHFGVDNEA